jgi:hypothetical protein
MIEKTKIDNQQSKDSRVACMDKQPDFFIGEMIKTGRVAVDVTNL